jgi:hypothetical protein
MSSSPSSLAGPPVAPWWRFRIVWLVAALPALAVAGSLISATIAVRHADPIVAERLPAAEDAGTAARRANPMEPAQQARNHASLKRP